MKLHEITVRLTTKQLKGLRAFAEEYRHWHLADEAPETPPIPDDLAVLLCIMYTAVGPKRPNEVGACSLDAAEIDDGELIEFARGWLKAKGAR